MVFANACVYALVRVYLTYSLTHTSTDQLLEQASMAKTKQNQNLSAQFSPADKTDRAHCTMLTLNAKIQLNARYVIA